jgi:putative ubiquitin-RnfH superfamily antitoxin RatB of RatAB toxin-antitoxin module
MKVEVVYALPERQALASLNLEDAATVADALSAVADTRPFSELDLARVPVGVFGESVARDAKLRDGDRVEIYRTLLIDPKEARRRRAGSA